MFERIAFLEFRVRQLDLLVGLGDPAFQIRYVDFEFCRDFVAPRHALHLLSVLKLKPVVPRRSPDDVFLALFRLVFLISLHPPHQEKDLRSPRPPNGKLRQGGEPLAQPDLKLEENFIKGQL